MKKIAAIVLTLIMCISCFGVVGHAKVGDVIGTAYHTDIVVYINYYAIPSYAVNGQSVIVAEHLRNFGFDVIWNDSNRSLTISRNSENNIGDLMFVGKGYNSGERYTDILETDISVYANGQKLKSYAMNGFTMIPVEQLTMFGEVNWVASERALKMWVQNLPIYGSGQPVAKRYYNGTYAPEFGWITESVCYFQGTEYSYKADEAKLRQYVDYIVSQGWAYDKKVNGPGGKSYEGYINKNLKTGIAVMQQGDKVFVMVKTNVNAW